MPQRYVGFWVIVSAAMMAAGTENQEVMPLMFTYILRARREPGEQTDEFFRRFKEQPVLLHAYSLQGEDDPTDSAVVAIWESREAAESYLQSAPLRRDVDQAILGVSRTRYTVRDST